MQTNHPKIYKTFIINALITELFFLAELFFCRGKKPQTFIIATKKPFYHWQLLDLFFNANIYIMIIMLELN